MYDNGTPCLVQCQGKRPSWKFSQVIGMLFFAQHLSWLARSILPPAPNTDPPLSSTFNSYALCSHGLSVLGQVTFQRHGMSEWAHSDTHIQTRTFKALESVAWMCFHFCISSRCACTYTFMIEPIHVRRAAARVLSARRHRAPLGQDQTAQDRWKSGKRWKTGSPSFSFSICVTWLIYWCDMTHSYLWHDPCICVS